MEADYDDIDQADDFKYDASREVSELFYESMKSMGSPREVDRLIESDERYRSDEVVLCLQEIEQSSGEQFLQERERQEEINSKMSAYGFSPDYGESSEAFDMYIWSASMQDAVSGTRWKDTEAGGLYKFVWDHLSDFDTYYGYGILDEMQEMYDEWWDSTNGRMIICR